jgi:hypothetical protein
LIFCPVEISAEIALQIALPDPCGFCGRAGCKVEVKKSGKTLKTTSSCLRQHPFAYGHAKKYSAATPSTNVPIPCILCDIVPPSKNLPAFWKYSMPSHIRAAHPRFWDDTEDIHINLDAEFASKIAISREELEALGISMGLSTAPPAQSLFLPRGTKRSNLENITNTSSKRQRAS